VTRGAKAVWAVVGLWTVAVVVYYGLTVADNCGSPDGDCGAAIGLGLLVAAIFWLAGLVPIGIVALVAFARRPRCPVCEARRPRTGDPCPACGASSSAPQAT
jgi:hypothetical protein